MSEPYEIQPRPEGTRAWAIYLRGGALPIIVYSIMDLNALFVEARRTRKDVITIGDSSYVVADIAHISPWRQQ